MTLTVNIDTAIRLCHVNIKHGEPTLLIGPYGIGKSTAARVIAQDLNARLVDFRASLLDRVDFGLPMPDATTKTVEFWMSAMLPVETYPGEPIVLLLDEISNAPPSVQGVLYQVALDRKCGTWVASPNTVIIAAANPKGGAAGKIVEGLASRFSILHVIEDVPSWIAYARRQGLASVLIAFIQWRHSKGQPILARPQAPGELAFATPRACEMINKYIVDQTLSDADLRIMVASRVGEAWSGEFMAFRASYANVPKLADIMAHPDSLPVPTEGSIQWACATMISEAMSDRTVDTLSRYLARMDGDYRHIAWQQATLRDPSLRETRAYVSRSLADQD